jgi:hypothetical protein
MAVASRVRLAGPVAAGAEFTNAALRMLMRLVLAVAVVIAALIALAIVLRLIGANASNSVVHDIHVAANFFAGAFTTVFKIHDGRLSLLVNWGIAAGVFLLAGAIVARIIAWIAGATVMVGPRSEV